MQSVFEFFMIVSVDAVAAGTAAILLLTIGRTVVDHVKSRRALRPARAARQDKSSQALPATPSHA